MTCIAVAYLPAQLRQSVVEAAVARLLLHVRKHLKLTVFVFGYLDEVVSEREWVRRRQLVGQLALAAKLNLATAFTDSGGLASEIGGAIEVPSCPLDHFLVTREVRSEHFLDVQTGERLIGVVFYLAFVLPPLVNPLILDQRPAAFHFLRRNHLY